MSIAYCLFGPDKLGTHAIHMNMFCINGLLEGISTLGQKCYLMK